MSNTLFTNVRIIDGSGAPPYAGEVLVQGNRISGVTRGGRPAPVAGVTVIDAAGATLMPGMTEAHVHLAWNNSATLDAIQLMPLEEHMLLTAANARLYLDSGWTSAVGAATAKPRLDVVIRNSINEGLVPVPRAPSTRGNESQTGRGNGFARASARSWRRWATTRCPICPSRNSASARW